MLERDDDIKILDSQPIEPKAIKNEPDDTDDGPLIEDEDEYN